MKSYSAIPPEYVEAFPFDPSAVTAESLTENGVLTNGKSLMERAADLKVPNPAAELQSLFAKVDQMSLNPRAFVANIDKFTQQLNGVSTTKVPVIDPTKVKVAYNKLEGLQQHVHRADKKGAIQNAVNRMKSIERSVKQHLNSINPAKLFDKAKTDAAKIAKRAENAGKELGK